MFNYIFLHPRSYALIFNYADKLGGIKVSKLIKRVILFRVFCIHPVIVVVDNVVDNFVGPRNFLEALCASDDNLT